MTFDEILLEIGQFGTYQKRLYFLLCLPIINVGLFTVISVFLLGVPNHRCSIPGYENDTYKIQSDFHELVINKTIPESANDIFKYDECHIFPASLTYYDNYSRPINATMITCDRWVYDDSIFKSTFVSQTNLICDDAILTSVAQMLYFAGVLIGSLVFGILSDVIGRKKVLMISLVLINVSTIGLAWANSYGIFVFWRILTGAANEGVFMTALVLGMEMVGPSKRVWTGMIIEYFFALGLTILAGLAYFIREWQYLEMSVAFTNLIFLCYFWIIPESPRWLVSQGRIEEAKIIMQTAAKINKKSFPKKLFEEPDECKPVQKGKLWHLFSTKAMFIRTMIIFLNWIVVSMVYYGLSLNTGNLAGDFYLNFAISGLIEFPADTLCILLLDRVGRKLLHCISMVVGGVACICTIFTTIYGGQELEVVTVTLAMIGKLGATAAYGVIYVYSAELFPTTVRIAGLGASSCVARIGGMLAPLIADLNKFVPGDFGRALPLVTFGSASTIAGVFALLLPETLNKQLPETIADARLMGNKQANARYEKEVYVNAAFTEDQITNGKITSHISIRL